MKITKSKNENTPKKNGMNIVLSLSLNAIDPPIEREIKKDIPIDKNNISIVFPPSCESILEHCTGFEPVPSTWQAEIITNLDQQCIYWWFWEELNFRRTIISREFYH